MNNSLSGTPGCGIFIKFEFFCILLHNMIPNTKPLQQCSPQQEWRHAHRMIVRYKEQPVPQTMKINKTKGTTLNF